MRRRSNFAAMESQPGKQHSVTLLSTESPNGETEDDRFGKAAERDAGVAGPSTSAQGVGNATSAGGPDTSASWGPTPGKGYDVHVWEEGRDPPTPYVIYNFVKYAVEPGRQLRDYKLWRGRNVMPRLDQSPKVWYFGEFRPDQGYEIEDIPPQEQTDFWDSAVARAFHSVLGTGSSAAQTPEVSEKKKCD